MSWTRLDGAYDTHRKMSALGAGQRGNSRRWIWTRILIYTNNHASAEIPPSIGVTIPEATPKFIEEVVQIGLADRDARGHVTVHDWPIYAAVSLDEKVAYYLSRKPDASANEVAKAVGGNRRLVLVLVSRHQDGPSRNGSGEPQLG